MLAPDSVLNNRYRIVRILGRGRSGFVYEARDERLLSKDVAIREVFFTDKRAVEVFTREASIQAELYHRALPKVTDFFVDGEGKYLVMDFIPGETLSDMLYQRGTPFPPEDVLNWVLQLLDLLNYLHNQKPPIVLRSIKPENLKLAGRNTIVLLDYAFARRLAEGSSPEDAEDIEEEIVGTPTFTPPEQLQSKRVDARGDLYSLAATMHWLATGVLPPDALTRLRETLSGATDPLHRTDRIDSPVQSALEEVLLQAMALDPDERPASAAEMRSLLSAAEAQQKSVTSQINAIEPHNRAADELTHLTDSKTVASVAKTNGEPILQTESNLQLGAILQGRYEVVKNLGEGAMGHVYLVRHRTLGDTLVLKENQFADPASEMFAQLNREAAVLANLNHPQLPRVHNIFVEDGRSYAVMEFIEGHSLQQLTAQRKEPFEEERVTVWAISLCNVLEYLHGHHPPIIHCDIKPDNIVVTPEGTVKVLDVGIARIFTETSSDHAPSAYTHGFASPEQWSGKINPGADVFSLGALMYYLLTRETIREDGASTAKNPGRYLRSINPQVSQALNEIINKCLKRNEHDRWETVRELRDALELQLTSRKYQNVLDQQRVQELREARESVQDAIQKRFLQPATSSPSLTGRRDSQPLPNPEYDAFISYRRQNGSSEARLIRAELLHRQNIRAFLDVDDLGAGHFDEALLECIADIPNFILVLSPNCLERCADERDWLRQEIVQALKTHRKVVPIMLPGFQFPEPQSLPEELRTLSSHQSVFYSHEYFDAMIAKVIRYLRQT